MDTREGRRNRQELIEVFKMCKGLSGLKLNELFTSDDNISINFSAHGTAAPSNFSNRVQ